jgi:hypothetical protein
MWHGHKPRVQHHRVFGCDAYVHVHKAHRTKLDAKAVKGIFIGYDPVRENGYRVYDIVSHRVIVSRDVRFFEQSFSAGRELLSQTGLTTDDAVTATILSLPSPWQMSFEAGSTPAPAPAASQKSVAAKPHVDLDEDKHDHEPQDTDTPQPDSSVPASAAELPPSRIPVSSLSSLPPPKRSSSRIASQQSACQSAIDDDEEDAVFLSEMVLAAAEDDDMPQTHAQAIGSADGAQWKKAIEEEIESLTENDTFRYVKRSSLPAGTNIMGYRWVFKVKLKADGTIDRYKARLVAKGFTQKEGIDYNETFAPVVRYKSLRMILVIATVFNYELTQMDVVTAFLNALVDEDVYMRVPEGFAIGKGNIDDIVLKLYKTLYGTKQAPHMWNNALNAFIVSIGFVRMCSDTCVYVKRTRSGNMIVVSIFVDDIMSAYSKTDEKEWLVVKNLFMTKYKMKDLGEVSWILGMKLSRDRVRGELSLDQSLYLNKKLARFNMLDCKPASTPESCVKLTKDQCPTTDEEVAAMRDVPYMSAIGSLLYAAIASRPDIAHAVNVVSKFAQTPGQAHWVAVKRILRYIKGTVNRPLVFRSKGALVNNNKELNVSVFTDADWAGDVDDRRSTSGHVVRIGSSSVIWSTKKQKTVSLSSAEAEYMALASAAQEVKWVHQFLHEMFDASRLPLVVNMSVYVDNQAAILISKNDVYHDRTKHIDIRYHYVRESVKSGLFKVEWVPTDQQLADGLTKGLGSNLFTSIFKSVMNS